VIWNNWFIKANKGIILYKNCLACNVMYVRDFYSEEGRPLRYNEFITKYNVGNFPFTKLNGIHHSIPALWRPSLHSLSLPRQPTNQHIALARFTAIEKVCRYAYNIFNSQKIETPRGCIKWDNVFKDLNMDWNEIFLTCKQIKEVKIRSFQYRFLQRIIGTNSFLCKIKVIDNAACTFCNEAEETIDHLFWSCSKVSHIWHSVEQNVFQSRVHINYENVCFGYSSLGLSKWYNFVVFHVKYYIYYSRVQKVIPDYDVLKHKIIFNLNVQKYLLKKNKNYRELEKLEEFQIFL